MTGSVSGPESYAGAVIGGAAGGAVFGATGNAVAAGAVGGAVQSGVSEALTTGSTVGSIATKAAVGGASGAVLGGAGKYVAAAGKGPVAKIVSSTKAGKAVANNEKMANMMRGKLAKGQIKDVSEATKYKMIGAGVTSGSVPATVQTTGCKASKKC